MKMKKLTMFLAASMLAMTNTWAAPVAPVIKNFEVPIDAQVGDVIGTVVGTSTTGDPLTYKDRGDGFAQNKYYHISDGGVITLQAKVDTDFSVGDNTAFKLELYEDYGTAEEEKIQPTLTIKVVAGGSPVIQPDWNDEAFTQDFSANKAWGAGDWVGTSSVSVSGGTNLVITDDSEAFVLLNGGFIKIEDPSKLVAGTTNVTFTATNDEGGSTDLIVPITVQDPTVSPTWAPVNTTIDVVAGQVVGTVIATSTATSDSDVFEYYLQGAEYAKFDLNTETGVLSIKDAAAFANPGDTATINVECYDLEWDYPSAQTFTFNVVGAPVAPNITSLSMNVPEIEANGFSLGNVVTEGGYGALTYSFATTVNTDVFDLSPSGEVTLKDATKLDFEEVTGEKTFTLNIKVTDSLTPTAQTDIAIIQIGVTNVPEVSTSNLTQTRTIFSDATGNVGAPVEFTAEAGSSISTGGSGATNLFATDDNGQVTVKPGVTLVPGDYVLLIRIYENVGSTYVDVELTITVNPIASDLIDPNQTLAKIPEDTPIGPTGVFVNAVAGVTFSLSHPKFSVDAATGEISLKSMLDYEDTVGYTFGITVTKDGNTDSGNVTIITGNIDDTGEVLIIDQTRSIIENSSNGTNVGAVLNINVDFPDNIEFSTTSSEFTVLNNGQIQVNTSLDYETLDTYTIDVTILDTLSNAISTATITINITDDVTDNGGGPGPVAPTINDQEFTFEEGQYGIGATGLFVVANAENAFKFSESNAVFDIDADTGEIIVLQDALLVEGYIDFFTVTVTDDVNNKTATAVISFGVIAKGTGGSSPAPGRKKSSSKCIVKADGGFTGASVVALFMMLAIAVVRRKKKEIVS